MPGLGTLINAAGILVGGLIGIFCGKYIGARLRDMLTAVMGISVIFIGAAGVLEQMLVIGEDGLSTQGSMMMIFSLVLGGLVGSLLKIEDNCERFGVFLRQKTGNGGDTRFVEGFVTASLTVCIGAMAVMGAIADGISGDISILTTKAILDLVILIVMAASMGIGCLFSAIPVVILQGSVTLLARVLVGVMTDAAISNLSLVGSVLIFCVGINLTFGKKIAVGDLLPSIVFAVMFAFIPIF
ncbi:MAG: DUF554 domain-containing protein [Clostridia bacterium]|nr:DUF554 domain-containing protein [Clostridia bacterium]